MQIKQILENDIDQKPLPETFKNSRPVKIEDIMALVRESGDLN